MEKMMKRPFLNLTLTAALALAALAFVPLAHPQSAVTVLLERARTQEQAGHLDLASQSWQQVLLSDPNNVEALTGLARAAKMSGNEAEAQRYIDRLRHIDPTDPNIAKVQGMISSTSQNSQLQQAAKLAQNGHPEDALKVYRQVWGNHPPDGNWALAYYDTEASTDAGREDAINGLRALAKKYPSDPRYSVTLGRILTYRPQTRAEGEKVLRQYPQDPAAQTALRQSLVWDSQNPNAAPAIRDYLKQHKDAELAQSFAEAQTRQAQTNKGVAQSGPEQAAYKALSANRVDEAQSRFLAIQAKEPNNPRVLAGLGFVRMKQGNFAEAIVYLEQAQQNGMKGKDISDALTTSHFWLFVQQGTTALNDNRLDEAADKYRSALALRPNGTEALEGLGGVYMKAGQPAQAVGVYEQLVKSQPKDSEGWRNLFTAQVQAGQPAAAIATTQRFPAPVQHELAVDPEYLRNLSAAYTATGQDAEARKVLESALSLPFPDNGRNMKAETRMQYASLLAASRRYPQAAGIYRDIVTEDPGNVSAWQGLVAVQHQAAHDADAVETIERMPPATYEAALQDAGFLSMLAAIYQQQNHLDVAQGFLQRAAKLQAANGQSVAVPLQLQLASIYLQQNSPQQAYAIYRSVLTQNPDRIDAWKGLISALHQTGHDQDALAQIQQIPPDVRRTLDQDVQYQQSLAAIYAAMGNQQAALQMLGRIQAHYRAAGGRVPADVEIQNGYLLLNAHDNRDLYRTLMALGGRNDLTDAQRLTIQSIWTSWSVQRAGEAVDAGKTDRALQILNAASQAFPDNPDVSKALATGYLKAGDPKQAMAIYDSLDLSNPSVSDYQGMVGAALALPNMKQAETWLRMALAAYPKDPAVLALAARFEQARGDNTRAADYWKATLNAMPPVSPANKLAHTLNRPDGDLRQTQSLANLLNPDSDSGMGRQAVPALPSYESASAGSSTASTDASGTALYGPDPYSVGTAPVQLNRGGSTSSATGTTQTVPTQTTVTTTTTTYAPPVRHTVTQHANAASAATATAPKPVTAHPHKTATSAESGVSGRTYTTTQTTTQTGTSTGGVTSSGSSGQRLGDYVPQAPSQTPPQSLLTPPPVQKQPFASENADAFAPPAVTSGAPGNTNTGNTNGGVENDTESGPPPVTLSNAQLHLSISSGATLQPGADVLEPTAPQTSAVQLTLDASPAIQFVPNSSPSIEAYNHAASTLDAAAKPIDAAYLPTQYTPAPSEVTPQPYTAVASSVYVQQTYPLPQQGAAQQPPAQVQQTQQQVQQAQQTSPPPPGWNKVKETVTTTTTTTADAQQQGATDEQLQQQNLPPLRGPYGPRRPIRQRNPREEAEMQLATIEGGYSPWMGGTAYANHRSGTPGFDQLTALEAPFEATTTVGGFARLSVVAMPSFLDSGTADGTSTNRLGTLPVGAAPAAQSVSGIGGEVQFSTSNFRAAAGYTPFGFLVSNAIGRVNWHPAAGPFTFNFAREAVKDSQLSYSGLHDPGSAGPGYEGNIWGGVITNAGNFQYSKGDAKSGYYLGAGGQYITGHHVESNNRVDGVGGAYWHALSVPDIGDLTIGANFFGMHYAHNLRFFTYGQGGYFSPQSYFLANVPITWSGRYGVNLHYSITGALGIQAFQEDSSPFFPLDPALQVVNNNPSYPSQSVVGSNYDVHAEAAYHLTDHWYAGGFASFNNTRDYASQSVGFFIRFMVRPQYPTELGPTGLFPYQGTRPLMVP
jgi:cellulose synthase operon protein C